MTKLDRDSSAWIPERPRGEQLPPPTTNTHLGLLCVKQNSTFLDRPMNRARLGPSVAEVNVTRGYTLIHQSRAISIWQSMGPDYLHTEVLTRSSVSTNQESKYVGNYQEY